MQVGDLIKPKCEHNFASSGYAIITRMNDLGDVVIVWLDDQLDNYMRWWQLEENFEIVKNGQKMSSPNPTQSDTL